MIVLLRRTCTDSAGVSSYPGRTPWRRLPSHIAHPQAAPRLRVLSSSNEATPLLFSPEWAFPLITRVCASVCSRLRSLCGRYRPSLLTCYISCLRTQKRSFPSRVPPRRYPSSVSAPTTTTQKRNGDASRSRVRWRSVRHHIFISYTAQADFNRWPFLYL